MAAVLETLTIPRSSTLPPQSFTPAASGSYFSSRQTVLGFSQFKGLKVQLPTRFSVSSNFASKKSTRGGGRIVCEAQDTALDTVPPISEAQWKSLVIESDLPVLVEFWAPWCGPCRMIQATIDEMAKEYAGKIKFYKVNTDDCPGIATQFGIRSIPTVMVFKAGEKKEAVIGAVPKSTLISSIEKYL